MTFPAVNLNPCLTFAIIKWMLNVYYFTCRPKWLLVAVTQLHEDLNGLHCNKLLQFGSKGLKKKSHLASESKIKLLSFFYFFKL